MYKRSVGFSLIELMIVVAIIGVLSAIAYPAYTDSANKSRRADAITTLLDMQLQQEKHRSINSSYTTTLGDIGYGGGVSPDGYYDLAIDNDAAKTNANGFEMTATAKNDAAQSGDASCQTFTLTQAGPDIGDATKRTCWNK